MATKARPQDGPHEILKPIIYRGEGELNGQILRPSGDKDNPTIAPSFGHMSDVDYRACVVRGFIKPAGGKS